MRFFESAQSWLITGFFFLLPLFFLPITSEFFAFNKLTLLVLVTLVGWILWALSKTQGEFRFRVTPFDLPVLAFALVFLVSSILVSPNKYDAFLFPGTTTWILAGTLLYFLVLQDNKPSRFLQPLLTGVAIAAVVSTLSGVGVLASLGKLLNFPVWATQPGFSTTGDLLTAITLYGVVGVFALAQVIESRRTKYSPMGVALLVLVVAGLVASVYQAIPGKNTSLALLPLGTGWAIALETLKQNLLLGVGPGNFVEAFNRFRPVDFNSSSVWTLRFITSSNWYLTVWTVAGLLGIGSFLWLAWTVLKRIRGQILTPVQWALVATLVLFLVLPATLPLIVAFYLFLAVVGASYGQELALQFAAREAGISGRRTNLMPGIIALLAAAVLIGVGYYGGRAYAAEMKFRDALNASAANDGIGTYNALNEAIRLNPSVDRYRTTASQINLAIANSIAQKKDLTEEERKNVAQLIQQAVQQSQAAVALHRTNAGAWENLARLYQSLISFAQDAKDFSIGSYQQAIALDPVNPLLRISFGGLYYSLKDYDNAIRVFELAVASKPDFANAHYNLAIALRDKGDIARAAQEMQATVSLLKEGTADYDKAKSELDELQKKVAETATPSAQPKQGANQPPLQAPSPAPTPAIDPQLDLPDTAAPPSTESAEPTPAPLP